MSGPPVLDRRLVFVLGKGGVGKSAVAAAMGMAWARQGRRALVVEVAGQHRLSGLFAAREVADNEEVELAPGLFGISIDTERSTEEYLASQLKVRPLVDLLTRSRAFHNFAAAAPGLAEMVTLGKIWNLAIQVEDGTPVWDKVVVDCPATGHGIALIEIAGRVGEMTGQGPIHDQAERIQEVVTHPAATGIVVVARPEELPVSEALEAVATLREGGYPVAATVLNGMEEARFSPDEAPALEQVAVGDGPEAVAARSALAALRRRALEDGYRERLAAGAGSEPIVLPALRARALDLDGIGVLAAALSDGAGSGAAPAAAVRV